MKPLSCLLLAVLALGISLPVQSQKWDLKDYQKFSKSHAYRGFHPDQERDMDKVSLLVISPPENQRMRDFGIGLLQNIDTLDSLNELIIHVNDYGKNTALDFRLDELEVPLQKASGITTVHLYWREGQSLPAWIYQNPNIKNLSLVYINQPELSQPFMLPKELSQMKHLESLFIEGYWRNKTAIDQFPKDLKGMKSLSELMVVSCKFKDFGADLDRLGQLPNLKRLSLLDCGIEELPPSIGKLDQLEFLNLANVKGTFYNSLTALPQEMKNLKSLHQVVLSEGYFVYGRVVQPAQKEERAAVETELRQVLPADCLLTLHYTCFPAGAKVLMASGEEVKIEKVKVRDLVMAADGAGQELVASEVIRVDCHEEGNYALLEWQLEVFPAQATSKGSLGNQLITLRATPNHPMLRANGETALMEAFESGDEVLWYNADNGQVEQVQIVAIRSIDQPVDRVYNLQTSHGNYFVQGINVAVK